MKRLIILTAIALLTATAPGCYHGYYSGYRRPLLRNWYRNHYGEQPGCCESSDDFSPAEGCNSCGTSTVMPGEYLPPIDSPPVLPGPGISG